MTNEPSVKAQLLSYHFPKTFTGVTGSWLVCAECDKHYPCKTVQILTKTVDTSSVDTVS